MNYCVGSIVLILVVVLLISPHFNCRERCSCPSFNEAFAFSIAATTNSKTRTTNQKQNSKSKSNQQQQQRRRVYYQRVSSSLALSSLSSSDVNADVDAATGDGDGVVAPSSRPSSLPVPPLSTSNPNDDFFRLWQASHWPDSLQHALTSTGITRFISDALFVLSLPVLVTALQQQLQQQQQLEQQQSRQQNTTTTTSSSSSSSSLIWDFIKLTNIKTTLYYGWDTTQQFIDLYEPQHYYSPTMNRNHDRGLVVFVHGGAWGSGAPWMYRMLARSFLEQGYTFAIIGYRTYPTHSAGAGTGTGTGGSYKDQIDDIRLAMEQLRCSRPDLMRRPRQRHTNNPTNPNHDQEKVQQQQTYCDYSIEALIGHSSGAHIALHHIFNELFIQRKQQRQQQHNTTIGAAHSTTDSTCSSRNNNSNNNNNIVIKQCIALSGVYDIGLHYVYERGRGVDQISAMRVACANFSEASPINHPFLVVDDDDDTTVTTTNATGDSNSDGDNDDKPVHNIQKGCNNTDIDTDQTVFTFVHGINDDIVQYNHTCVMVDAMRHYYYQLNQQKQQQQHDGDRMNSNTIRIDSGSNYDHDYDGGNSKSTNTNNIVMDTDNNGSKKVVVDEYLLNIGHADTVIQLVVDSTSGNNNDGGGDTSIRDIIFNKLLNS